MSDSAAGALPQLERPAWKTAINWIATVLVALLFLVAGLWKISDLPRTAVKFHELKVPENLSLAAALVLGVFETFAGVLLVVPRFRRWGSWLSSLMLIVFMIYIGFFYNELRGQECSCFPWVKRAVGPMFFVGDGIMLLFAMLAGLWTQRPESVRGAGLVLGAVMVFAAASLGVSLGAHKGTKAPSSITVDGKPFSMEQGKVLIFFFDPQCLHCLDAAKKMSKMNWGDTKVVVVPVKEPQLAHYFLQDSALHAGVSNDFEALKTTFPYVSTPAAVAVEDGREKAPLTQFEGAEPEATLKKLQFIY